MTASNIDINDLIAKLQEAQAALGDGCDLRSENEKAAHYNQTVSLSRTVSALRNLPDDLKRFDTKLADLAAERAAVVAKQDEIVQEMDAAPDPSSIRDGRARDTERERIRQLHLSLERLAQGTLAYAPDRLYRPLPYLDQRIVELRARRDVAQATLDSCLQQAELLLDAEPPTEVLLDAAESEAITP